MDGREGAGGGGSNIIAPDGGHEMVSKASKAKTARVERATH